MRGAQKGSGAAAPAQPAAAKPSTAEILAAARAKKAPAADEPAAEPVAEEAAPAAEPTVAPKAKKPAAGGALPTTTADKIAWCRANDAKS